MGLIIFVHVRVVTCIAVDRPLLDSGNGWSIGDFAAGLHREGSKAVFRYTSLELADRFALLNAAFGEEGYKWERLENYGNNIVSGPFFTQGIMLPLTFAPGSFFDS